MPQPTMTLKPPKAKLSISNPVYGKGRRYAGSATMIAASLSDVFEPRVTVALSVCVTVSVTGVVTMISSALRRMWLAYCHTFNRRLARIRFQPHWRASSAALAVTRSSG